MFSKPKIIEVTGPYTIQSEDYWITEKEADPFLKDGSLRQLQIRRYYPSGVEAFRKEDAKPVVIASHGSFGTIENNLSLYRELVSHGYEVLAVGHPGHAASVVLENGKKIGPSKEFMSEMGATIPNKKPEEALEIFRKWMDLRLCDLNYVMDDYIEKNGNEIKFIALGHSLGGSAALALARTRKEICSCVALESPYMYDIKGVENDTFVFDDSDYTIPVLHIYSDSSWKYLYKWKQYKNNVRFLESDSPLYTNIHYEGTGHMGICDLSLALPALAQFLDKKIYKVKPVDQLTKINRDVMAFLEKNR